MHRGASLLIGVVPLRSLLADKDRSGWFIIYQYLCVLVKGMSFWDRTPKHSVRADTAALVHTHLLPPPTLYSSPSPPLPSHTSQALDLLAYIRCWLHLSTNGLLWPQTSMPCLWNMQSRMCPGMAWRAESEVGKSVCMHRAAHMMMCHAVCEW